MVGKIIFPTVCGFCFKLIDKGYVCDTCMKGIEYLGFSYIPFIQDSYFDKLICNYKYVGIVRKRILDYKFKHKKYLCRTFAEGMIYRLKKEPLDIDIIIPVPISRKRRKQRGYNQSDLIAKIVAREINMEYSKNILLKLKENSRQSKLNKKERLQNVKNVFGIKQASDLVGKKVLLIDDIYTTGATVNECSKVLRKAGASKVIVYTVACATVNSHID